MTMPGSKAILILAALPPDIFAWADGLRRKYYPPERNRLPAHVTLFHGLPPSAAGEVQARLQALAAQLPPPAAQITGIMDLHGGTALRIRSAGMEATHAELAAQLHGIVQQRDRHDLQLHITLQHKVPLAQARDLQAQLAKMDYQRSFHFTAFATHRWDGELWRFERKWPFRRGVR